MSNLVPGLKETVQNAKVLWLHTTTGPGRTRASQRHQKIHQAADPQGHSLRYKQFKGFPDV